ncbi:MAG TPA: tetratricopeptide repeat protein [Ramlibacter sp.]|nr:tetratricopeptide repeat protein [Ramlibacter sp.]
MWQGLARWWRGTGGGDAPAGPVAATAAPTDWIAQGNAALAQGRMQEAAEAYARASEADPRNPAARLNHGFALLELGQAAAALTDFTQCLALAAPGDRLRVDAQFLAGRAHASLGRAGEAAASYQAALADAPAFEEARVALAQLRLATGATAQVLELTSGQPLPRPLALVRAQALHAMGRAQESLALVDGVLAQDPACAPALDGRGVVLMDQDRAQEAIASFERAVAAAGATPDRLANLAAAYQRLARLDEAIAHADGALQLAPGHPRARWNRALSHLLRGELARGWEDFEARWDAGVIAGDTRLRSHAPRWTGEDLRGRSILLDMEQGLGDTLQFLRYVPVLADRGAGVCVRVQAPLVDLVRASLPDATVLAPADPPPPVDFYCELLSVPRWAGVALDAIPSAVPYLQPDPGRVAAWEERLAQAAQGRLRVGLVWSGNPGHLNDRNRSITLRALQPLADLDVLFVSMKPDLGEADRASLAAWPRLLDAGPRLKDFSDTAALIHGLDLVLSVDTSVAHLAGALGKPVWILLPWLPDWRWMLGREDSPWYPTAHLYRQVQPQDWSAPLQRVQADLARRADQRAGEAKGSFRK